MKKTMNVYLLVAVIMASFITFPATVCSVEHENPGKRTSKFFNPEFEDPAGSDGASKGWSGNSTTTDL